MKVIDLMKKNIVPIMIFLFVVSLVYAGFQWGTNRQLKKIAAIAEKQAKDTKKEFDDYKESNDKRMAALEEDNAEKQRIIDAKEAENDELLRQREEDKQRIEDLERQVEESSPEDLVRTERRILGTNEIFWNPNTERAEFTLAAFRISTLKHLEWEDFTLVREPNYREQIANDLIIKTQLRGQVENLQEEVGGLKIGMLKLETAYTDLNRAFEDYKKLSKKGGIFATAGKILIGIGIYAVVDNVFFRD